MKKTIFTILTSAIVSVAAGVIAYVIYDEVLFRRLDRQCCADNNKNGDTIVIPHTTIEKAREQNASEKSEGQLHPIL